MTRSRRVDPPQSRQIERPAGARQGEVLFEIGLIKFIGIGEDPAPAPEGEAAWHGDLQPAGIIPLEFENHVARQPLFVREGRKHTLCIAHHAGIFGADPERTLRIFEETGEPIAAEAFRVVFIEDVETHAVVAHQPVERRKPQVTVARLRNVIDAVLRQTIVSRPFIEAVLRQGAGRSNRQTEERQH